MSRQALAQARHSFAHLAMCSSCGCFSHAAAQSSHILAQASHATALCGLCRAVILAASEQNAAQSAQDSTVGACSFLPSISKCLQWARHESHSSWQAAHALAHAIMASWCLGGSA